MIKYLKYGFRRAFRRPIFNVKRFSLSDAGASVDQLVAAVRKTELFCNADPSLVKRMLESMTVRHVRAGNTFLRQGGRSDCFVVLASGRAQVTRAREGTRMARPIAILNEPAGLGEEALLGAEIRSVSATMLCDGVVLSIRRSDFARLISAHGVAWLTPEEAVRIDHPPAAWLWAGEAKTRPRGMSSDIPTVELERLRLRLSEFDSTRHYLCCGRADATCALAAFLMTQRGFNASAVRDGRRVAAGLR